MRKGPAADPPADAGPGVLLVRGGQRQRGGREPGDHPGAGSMRGVSARRESVSVERFGKEVSNGKLTTLDHPHQ